MENLSLKPIARIFAALTISTALSGCFSDELNHSTISPSAEPSTSSQSFNNASAEQIDANSASCDAHIIEEAAENGEISASDFAFSACDDDLSTFEEENGFSFDENTSFDESEESEFGDGFSGSFESEEQESFTFGSANENRPSREATKPSRRNASFQDYGLSSEQAFSRAERTVGIPARLLRRIVNNEAIAGDPNSVNPTTGACGLGQLMPESTLPEMAYKYGPTFGFNVRDMVDRYVVGKTRGLDIIGYRPHRGERGNLRAQCLDEWTNVALFSMNLVEKMRRVDEQMARKGRHVIYNEADLYVAHFLGARDDIIWARRANPDAHAADFANRRTIRGNRHMFYDSNNRPRTIAGMYAYIKKGGPGPDQNVTVTPFWRTETTQIAARAQLSLNAG